MSIAKNKNTVVLGIAVVVGIIISFLPAAGGLTDAGVRMLAVFVPTIILWVGVGTGWTSLLALCAFVIFQVNTASEVFRAAWGSGVTTFVIPMFIIVNVMIDNGAMEYITEWILSRKIIHNRPYMFLFMLCVAVTVLGIAVYAVIMCCFIITLMEQICTSIGYTKEDKFFKASMMIVLWISAIMDGVWPFTRPIPILLIAFFQSLGYEISMLDWIKISIPFTILCIALALLIIKFVYRPDTSKFMAYDDKAIRERLKTTPLGIASKVALLILVVAIISWILPSFNIPVISPYFSRLGLPTIAYFGVLLMCFIKKEDGKPIIELGSAFSKVNWSLVLFIATMMYLAGIVGKDTFGVTAMISNYLAPVIAAMSYKTVMAIGLVVVCLLTNFMSSTVATTIVMTVFTPLILSYSAVSFGEVAVFCILIGCVSNAAYLTHAACPAAGVMLTTIPFGETSKYNALMSAGALIISICVVMPFLSSIL